MTRLQVPELLLLPRRLLLLPLHLLLLPRRLLLLTLHLLLLPRRAKQKHLPLLW
jgi:hypothetical protein